MSVDLTQAREALAAFDAAGLDILARRLSGQRKSAPVNRHLPDAEKYLRAALARVDELETDKADALRELADATDALDITHADYPERFEDGTLAHAIACEMHDFAAVMHGASKVYMHITGGKVGKPNTDPGVVIAMADDACTEAAQESREAGMVEQLARRVRQGHPGRRRRAARDLGPPRGDGRGAVDHGGPGGAGGSPGGTHRAIVAGRRARQHRCHPPPPRATLSTRWTVRWAAPP